MKGNIGGEKKKNNKKSRTIELFSERFEKNIATIKIWNLYNYRLDTLVSRRCLLKMLIFYFLWNFRFLRILQSELRQNELAIDNQAIEQELVRQYFNDQSRPINRRCAQFSKSWKVRLRHCVERHIVFSSRDWVLTMEGCFHCHALFGQHVDQDAELRSISSKYEILRFS